MRRSLLLAAVPLLLSAASARATVFSVTNLVTNDQAAHRAQIEDPDLKNAWGVAYPPSGPFWVSDNGAGVATLYAVNPATNATSKRGLTVTIPGDGSVTGQAFNPTPAFNGDAFLFVSEDGTVSGWRNALGTNAEVLATGSPANVYKGTAVIATGGHTYLLSANFRAGTIDVLKDDITAPDLAGRFTDPNLPANYAPFDIRHIGDKLYVTYALQDAAKSDDMPGLGHGFVDVYDEQGALLSRLASGGTLNSPWGLEIAPGSFGDLAGDLLVGNFGDGRVNAFDLATGKFVAQLTGVDGLPLTIDGLWALTVGNDGMAGSARSVYFSAGPDGKSNGLFGVIAAAGAVPVPEPRAIGLLGIGLAGLLAAGRLGRRGDSSDHGPAAGRGRGSRRA